MQDNSFKMLIYFRCDKCGQKYRAKLRQAGKTGHCKKCKGRIFVPDMDQSAEFSDTLDLSTSQMAGHLAKVSGIPLLLLLIGASIIFFIFGMMHSF